MQKINYLYNGGGKYDILKITLAVLIVALHTRPLSNDFQPILRLAVPIFFIMTSFFFYNKVKDLGKEETNAALGKFVCRNLLLYLFWFIVLIPVTLYRHNWFDSGIVMGLARMIRSFLFGSTFAASWFITSSVIAVTLTTFISRRCKNVWLLILSLLAYLFCSLDANYHHLICAAPQIEKAFGLYHLALGVPYISFPSALVWIVMGKIIAEHQVKISARFRYTALLIAFALLFVEHYIGYQKGWILDDDCYLFLLIVCPLIFIVISQYTVHPRHDMLMRKMSTMIYCSHLSLLTIIELCFSHYGIEANRWLLFLLCLASAFCLSCLILWLEEKRKIKILKYSH
ncbi:MAG: acyltransferase [Bacteroidales bacterium]|nr:acyltransferase [Candidatus Equimonas faecalis]